MGNPYSYTARVASQGPWYTNLNPAKLVVIAGSAVVQTAQLGVKVALAPITLPINAMSGVNQHVKEKICQVSGETATQITVYSSWLGDGSYSGVISSVTGPISGHPLTHWFAAIQTNDPNVVYWAELNNDAVKLQKLSSIQAVKKKGGSSGGNSNAENFTVKMNKSCYRSMSSIKQWVGNSNHHYQLAFHNCQHWAEELYNWI